MPTKDNMQDAIDGDQKIATVNAAPANLKLKPTGAAPAKIAFFCVSADEEKYLREALAKSPSPMDATFFRQSVGPENLPAERDFEIISVFVDCVVDRKVVAYFPKLKCVAARSTGYDHIDFVATREKGVSVVYVPAYGENTVAEFTFGLILNLSRKIGVAYDQVRETGSWDTDGLLGFDLKGKILGVVGTGRIGKHVVRIAKGFEMNVLASDPFPDKDYEKTAGFAYTSLDNLLSRSDIVTIHVPYAEETHHLIGAEAIGKMKAGSYLINTSRGAVVDTEALVSALKNKRLAGAGLDVLEEEGIIKDELDFVVHGHPGKHNLKTILAGHALIDMPNVIVTPHNAFNTREALNRILDVTVSNINAFKKGRPENIVKQ